MTKSTMPRVAIDLGDGLPWYPYRQNMDGGILFTNKPELPTKSSYWVTVRDDYRPRVDLDDVACAELLFCSAVSTGAELSDAEIRAAINATLTSYQCHLDRCRARHESEAGDYPVSTAIRFTWSIRCAAQLLGVEA